MSAQFQVNDYVKYGTSGVCRITELRSMPLPHGQKQQLYYVLKPISNVKSTVFVPADSDLLSQKMRSVIPAEQIAQILDETKSQTFEWIEDKNERADSFRKILVCGDPRELLMMISCLHFRGAELRSAGKRLTTLDDNSLRAAEKMLEDEFAFSLGIDPDKIGGYIMEKLNISTDE